MEIQHQKTNFIMIHTCSPIGVSTMPLNFWPSFKVLINPNLANFLPLHFFGSHCSISHIAIGKGISISEVSNYNKYIIYYYKYSNKIVLNTFQHIAAPSVSSLQSLIVSFMHKADILLAPVLWLLYVLRSRELRWFPLLLIILEFYSHNDDLLLTDFMQ